MTVRIFIHGLDSSNQGTKSVYFRDRYPDMIIPHFRGELNERMEELRGILEGKRGIRMVGSSFGGLMATLFAMEEEARLEQLVLLAPALNLLEFTPHDHRAVSVPVRIYHGGSDEVIPLDAVKTAAGRIFTHLSFNVVDDNHFLHKTFKHIDWDALLT